MVTAEGEEAPKARVVAAEAGVDRAVVTVVKTAAAEKEAATVAVVRAAVRAETEELVAIEVVAFAGAVPLGVWARSEE